MALNSWQFLVLAGTAVLLLPAVPARGRMAPFVALNAVFAASYWGGRSAAIGLGFCLAGYVCARLVAGRGARAVVAAVALLTVVFVALRGYSLQGLTSTTASASGGVLAFAGVSFLFFRMTHVVVDSAAGVIDGLPFWRYVGYCTNFTTLLMGPLQRYQDFAAQWTSPTFGRATLEQKLDAINRVLRGLVKAFALAAWLQPHVLHPGLPFEQMGLVELVLRVYGFYVYLYLDFSGYCDIVIGVGGLMGVRPPENFAFPFTARNVSSYWLRVHRTLTQWLTDYIFTPTYRGLLAGAATRRSAFLALAASLLVTMLVAGLWHGTTLNFVVFGLVHGLALVTARGYEHVMTRWLGRVRFRALTESWSVTAAAVFLTYNFTSLTYTFFVLDVDDSLRLFRRLAAVLGEGVA